jgi:hypothetical protein
MKKIYLLFAGITLFLSCTDDDEPTMVECSPTSVTLFDEAFTNFVFGDDGNGGQRVDNIVVYANTDSSFLYSYIYDGTNLKSITVNEGGTNLVYEAFYDNNKLSILATAGGPEDLAGELRLSYNGDNMSSLETWVEAIDGNFYQIGHFTMTYDGSGNMTRSEINLDFIALFTIAFGSSPTEPYTPAFFGSVEYEYGQDKSPNPLYGVYFMENPDMGFLRNLPINIIHKDETGSVTESLGFVITLDENGYPIKSTSGATYIEATYVCN